MGLEGGDDCGVMLGALATVGFDGDGVEAALAGCGETWRGGEIRDDDGDLGVGNPAGGDSVGDGEEVGAASGEENAEVVHQT